MIAHTCAVIGAGGVLKSVSCAPPLTLRRVFGEDPAVCHLCVVGSAAGPLAGDEVALELRLEDAARASLTASGATIAQGRDGGCESRLRTRVVLGEGAGLAAVAAPLVVAAGASVRVQIEIDLAPSALISWREVVVLGRAGEIGGDLVLSWSVRRAGEPVLIQTVDLRDPASRDWPGLLGGARVLATVLLSGPAVVARTLVDSPRAVCQRVDPNTALVTVLDRDAAAAGQALDALLAALVG